MASTLSVTKKEKEAYKALGERFGYTSSMQSPRLTKVTVSTGTGKVSDKQKIELIKDRLAKITGQKPLPCGAKKAIATFKTREGQIIGYKVTLRGTRMRDFLEKLIHVALPRTRDFHGISRSAVDEMGNLSIGIREHTIFPETSDEDVKDVFGLSVTVGTSAHSKEEAETFLAHLGIPFGKQ